MEPVEQLSSYGALGVLVAVLLAWTARDRMRLERRFDVESDYVRGVLRALIEECVLELTRVRAALDAAPCRPGPVKEGDYPHAIIDKRL